MSPTPSRSRRHKFSYVISAYALGVVVGAPVIAVLAAKMARRTLLLTLMLIFAA